MQLLQIQLTNQPALTTSTKITTENTLPSLSRDRKNENYPHSSASKLLSLLMLAESAAQT